MFSIKERRTELGMTLRELADKVGVSESTVSRWETGNIANMRRNKIEALAKALGVSPTKIAWMDEEDEIMKDEFEALREAYESRPEMRMLFSVASGCTAQEIEDAVKVIKALKK